MMAAGVPTLGAGISTHLCATLSGRFELPWIWTIVLCMGLRRTWQGRCDMGLGLKQVFALSYGIGNVTNSPACNRGKGKSLKARCGFESRRQHVPRETFSRSWRFQLDCIRLGSAAFTESHPRLIPSMTPY
jgi:hypothetical protein